MEKRRPTTRELAEAKQAVKREAMQTAIAEGKLTVRQMTPSERKAGDARRAEVAEERAARRATRS
jgi:hypothetical protein